MKKLILLTVCALVICGCRSYTPWQEATLGEGRYWINVPNVSEYTGTNCNPTVWIHECGRMQIDIAPANGGAHGEVWIDWTEGTIYGHLENSNGVFRQFALIPEGTNIIVKIDD